MRQELKLPMGVLGAVIGASHAWFSKLNDSARVDMDVPASGHFLKDEGEECGTVN